MEANAEWPRNPRKTIYERAAAGRSVRAWPRATATPDARAALPELARCPVRWRCVWVRTCRRCPSISVLVDRR